MNKDTPALVKSIRRALRQAEDGMTIRELEAVTGRPYDKVSAAVNLMTDVYVDRWQQPVKRGGGWAGVYMLVQTPPDCPKPKKE